MRNIAIFGKIHKNFFSCEIHFEVHLVAMVLVERKNRDSNRELGKIHYVLLMIVLKSILMIKHILIPSNRCDLLFRKKIIGKIASYLDQTVAAFCSDIFTQIHGPK